MFLHQSQRFITLNFKGFHKKSNIVEGENHQYLEEATIELILSNAKKQSNQMFVLISLLLPMAARIQDVIGISYGRILDGKRNEDGDTVSYDVYLEPKKTKGKFKRYRAKAQPFFFIQSLHLTRQSTSPQKHKNG